MRWIDRLREIIAVEEPPPVRRRLPDCRRNETVAFTFQNSRGEKLIYEACFGLDAKDVVREVFCNVAKTGTDLQALINDACVNMSISLQFGARIGDLAHALGELRDEVDPENRPASILGAIAVAGAELEAELAGLQL